MGGGQTGNEAKDGFQLRNHAQFMLTIYSFKTDETLAKLFFASNPVWWRRTRKTNSVLCIRGGCGSHCLSYGETQEIPSQIEIEKSTEGHTA